MSGKVALAKQNKQEIKSFFASLEEEKKLSMFDFDLVLKSEFVAVERVEKEIAGVIGIWRAYKLLPTVFLVVKKSFQGRKIGNKLMQREIEFASNTYDFLLLSTFTNGQYGSAIHLYKKYGFRPLFNMGTKIWLILPFNAKGEIIRWFLPMMILFLLALEILNPVKIVSQIINMIRRLFR